jgi:hypothetical protein
LFREEEKQEESDLGNAFPSFFLFLFLSLSLSISLASLTHRDLMFQHNIVHQYMKLIIVANLPETIDPLEPERDLQLERLSNKRCEIRYLLLEE